MRAGVVVMTMREVVDTSRGQSHRYAVKLSCGHVVGRNLLRLGRNRDRVDRIRCDACELGPARRVAVGRRGTRSVSVRDEAKFQEACRMLAELTAKGYEVYVQGSGNVHLMTGPSHDRRGGAIRSNAIVTCHVPRAGGGDW
jgi:hypothetical protein